MSAGRRRGCMLCWEFPPRVVGGLGMACAGLARAMAERMDLRVVTPPVSHYGAYASAYGDGMQAEVDGFAGVVADAVSRCGQIDFLYAHDWMTFPAAEWAARRFRVPWVAHVHSVESDRAAGGAGDAAIRQIEARGLRAADRIIAVSRKTAGDVTRDYGIDAGLIEVVWNGVEPVRAWRACGDEKRVVFLGRMTEQKSPRRFLQMAAQVARGRPELRFTMAGDGEQLGSMKQLAADFGLAEVVDFPGFLDVAAVRALWARSSVCALTSHSEPFGLVVLEAAQFGVPSVVFPNTGACEAMDSVRVAASTGEMARVVGEWVDDDARRERDGRQAAREVGDLTWSRAAQQVDGVLRGLCEG